LAFLKAEYRLLTFFVIGAEVLLAGISFIVPTHIISCCFRFGHFFLGISWKYRMKIATKQMLEPPSRTYEFTSSTKVSLAAEL
jgi:K(+)-stimulated pyrophosphate-energized sodium pump